MKMRFSTSTVAALAIVVILSSGANADLITNGSFEAGQIVDPFLNVLAGETSITGWTVTSGNVDYISTYWQASDGHRSLDMNGNTAGAISQDISTVVGVAYIVGFDFSANPDGGPPQQLLSVSATGASAELYAYTTGANSATSMFWVPETYTFTATNATTTLSFASMDSRGPYGPALDHVTAHAVPEPSSFALLALGGLGLATRVYRRRRTAAI